MKKFGLIFISTILLGTQALATGCSDMAAFNTQINEFLNTASTSDTLKADVKKLASECEAMHNQGMTISSISECDHALKLIMVN
jgi:outer membrane murein-binding lipoprotein Lpp